MLFSPKVFLEVMNSVLMTGEIPGLFAKDEMMAMTADLRNSFLKVGHMQLEKRSIGIQTFFESVAIHNYSQESLA